MNPELFLEAAGVRAPRRAVRLMHESVEKLGLDLRGLVVVTEAGSGVFALTPVLAALAGAERVHAFTRDSAWGTAAANASTVDAASAVAGVAGRIAVTEHRTGHVFAEGDVITNLGFVRPIDEPAVDLLKPTAVVALMCEAWELRPGDVDVRRCRERGVMVLGTNEHHPHCDVFRYSGPLAGQLVLDAGFELMGMRILVTGRDRFAPVIVEWLGRAGAIASQIDPAAPSFYDEIANADVLIVADYLSDGMVIGNDAMIDAVKLGASAPALTVIQFAGAIDTSALTRAGVRCWPATTVPARRMVRTFSSLGPAPVIRLHAAGLKVGELGARARLRGLNTAMAEELTIESGLAQRVGLAGVA